MSKELITQLSNLKIKESALKRNLDLVCFNQQKKSKIFEELTKVQEEIKLIKFKLRLEKEINK